MPVLEVLFEQQSLFLEPLSISLSEYGQTLDEAWHGNL